MVVVDSTAKGSQRERWRNGRDYQPRYPCVTQAGYQRGIFCFDLLTMTARRRDANCCIKIIQVNSHTSSPAQNLASPS